MLNLYEEVFFRHLFKYYLHLLVQLEIVGSEDDRERHGDNVDNSVTSEGCLAAEGEVIVLGTDSNEEGDDDSGFVENVCDAKFPELAICYPALSVSG